MDEARKQWLIENSKGATLEGSPVTIGGWKMPEATLAPHCGGFWWATWETAERVLTGNRNFTAADVRFSSWRWLGVGSEIPEAL